MVSIRKSISLLFLLLINLCFSQQRYWIINDTRFYEKPTTTSTILGFFKYGAEVKILEEDNTNWTKIQADNLTIGFVLKKLISTRLLHDDSVSEDNENPILKGGDNYYGGNHLFVTVAGLKARALPNKNASVKQILTNGEAVHIDYFPKNQDEWANIGHGFGENAKYVQIKFLGKRPDFDILLKQFNKLESSKIDERKTIAERLVELATNSEKSFLKPAFEKYLEVVKQLNDTEKIIKTEFNLFVLDNLHSEGNQNIEFANNSEFIINGKKSLNFIIPLNNLISTHGLPLKKETISDDCGIYLNELFYIYESIDASVDEKQNKAELVTVKITSKNKFSFNKNHILDNLITESEFIKRYGKYIHIDFKNPNLYIMYKEDSSILFEFKEGKLFSISINNYC